MPIQNFAVHLAIGLESLPLAARPQDRLVLAGQSRHVHESIGHECCAGTDFVGVIDKVARVEKIPFAVVIVERVSIDCE